MRYHISFGSPIDKLIAKKLSEEVKIFDIRAEVELSSFSTKKTLNDIDVLVVVGHDRSVKMSVKKGVMTFSLLQISSSNDLSNHKIKSNRVEVYPDLPPNSENNNYAGFHLFDALKSIDIQGGDEITNPYVVFLHESGKGKKVGDRLSSAIDNLSFEKINIEDELVEKASVVAHANAAIVSCAKGEMIALYYNIPFIRVTRSGIFFIREKSSVNALADQDLVKVVSAKNQKMIIMELNSILKDYQYCASMLEQFQRVKDKIGAQPSLRNIARDIVEKVDI